MNTNPELILMNGRPHESYFSPSDVLTFYALQEWANEVKARGVQLTPKGSVKIYMSKQSILQLFSDPNFKYYFDKTDWKLPPHPPMRICLLGLDIEEQEGLVREVQTHYGTPIFVARVLFSADLALEHACRTV